MVKNKLTMKKISLLLFFIFTWKVGWCQENYKVLKNLKNVGKNLITNEAIMAKMFLFPNKVHDIEFSVDSTALITLRGVSKNGKWLNNNGQVIKYDFNQEKTAWVKNIKNFQTSDIEQFESLTFYVEGYKSHFLKENSGEKLWTVKNPILFADSEKMIGIGYSSKLSKSRKDILQGIDLKTGNIIWERAISREYSWNGILRLNDSILLIPASGLHTVKLSDGKGWSYSTITGKKDHTASAVATGLGVIGGLLTGTYAFGSTGSNLVKNIASNVLIDSTSIYFASKERIVKLSKEGKMLWQHPLPKKLTSTSIIFKHKDRLVILNKGFAKMGVREINFGSPFIASFNLNTGKQNFLIKIPNDKKEMISSWNQKEDELILVLNNRILKYSILDGTQIDEKIFDSEKYGVLRYFIGDQVFIKKDSSYVSLNKTDPAKKYLYVNKGYILSLNNRLEIENKVNAEDLYISYLKKNDNNFLSKNGVTFIINAEGLKIAQFSASSNAIFFDNKLYEINERSILEIDIEKLVRPPQ